MLELELIEFIYQGVDPRTGELLNTPRDPVLDKHRAAYLQTLRKFTRKRKPAAFEGAKDPKLAPQTRLALSALATTRLQIHPTNLRPVAGVQISPGGRWIPRRCS